VKSKNKTKEELLKELAKLRQQIAKLKKSEAESKKAAKAIQQSEEMYKNLVKASPDAINVIDLNGYNIESSQKTLELFGYKRKEDILGGHMFENIAEKDHEKVQRLIQKILKDGSLRNVEITFKRRDGTYFIGETNAELIRDILGKPKAIIGTIRNITERKRIEQSLQKAKEELEFRVKKRTAELEKANQELKKELIERNQIEQSLRESEGIYKTLMKASPDATSITDLNGYNIELSQQTAKLLGYSKEEELLGRHMLEHIAPEDHKKA